MKMATDADSGSAPKCQEKTDEIIGEYSQIFVRIYPSLAGVLAPGLRRAVVLAGQL